MSRTGFKISSLSGTCLKGERRMLLLGTLGCMLSISAVRATPRLENAFEGAFEKKVSVKVSGDWKRKVYYGDWSVQADGSMKAVNLPEEGHGPLMTFSAPIDDAVIECEFMLPPGDEPDRHLRVFLACPEYPGHTAGAVANISTKSFPSGLKLYHQRKGKNRKVEEEIEFGTNPMKIPGGTWHVLKLILHGDRIRFMVNGEEVDGRNEVLDIQKDRVSLNFGKAGGHVRNFKVRSLSDK
ncbi:family 16 glycoside hydrolase [Pontiella agarivorans]|uniref:3-keto-alpha-glucoside-1,2-lyase/3-keto-2-hydroxy-glucal hydratase domain-containing protein n=1 Tax=Pontiella agarivorans TaxID=3038953 RepID=A0ABU5MYE3_9BACT|nr:family 16 glycoside hydrolase [Pontiella agarivorans]MDZ8119101.1 hypothetical protein [Pontiella agarivorans]